MLDAKFYRRVGPNVRDRYRKHIFGSDASAKYVQQAKDVYGKKFKPYKKNKKGISVYAQRKRADKFDRQASSFKNSTNPVLSSDLLRDFSLIRTSPNGFQIGWNEHGAIINHLAEMGRVLTADNQPLPNKVIRYLSKEAGLYMNKQMPKGTKTYRIGK